MAKQTYKDNGFIFTKNDTGTLTGEGHVSTKGVKCGSRVTPEGMQPGCQRGHLIAAQQGGPNKSYNMTAQEGKLNQGAYKKVENAEVNLVKEGYDVYTSKTAYVSTKGSKPDAYMINDIITSPEGKMQSVHLSFQNMSPEMQEQLNNELAQTDVENNYDNPDPLRESMSPEEYNSLMEETEAYLPSIKDEFDVENTSQTNFTENDTVDLSDCADNSADAGEGCDGLGIE